LSGIDSAKLRLVKERVWFYEFELPDGVRTQTDVPHEVREVHHTRLRHMLRVIKEHVPDAANLTAIDFASHEGYFSLELAKYFAFVRGFEIRPDSLSAARLIADALGVGNVDFVLADLQKTEFDEKWCSDFVLVYGLIYHMENPVHVLRLASQFCRRHILVETQLFPFDISGRVEDGSYQNQRAVNGVFALTPDYPARREGGSTGFALIPSLNAVISLLKAFGFEEVRALPPEEGDYEQFRRSSRVIVYGRKGPLTAS
jgi:tRNA (mo5U34)-methyltransferase